MSSIFRQLRQIRKGPDLVALRLNSTKAGSARSAGTSSAGFLRGLVYSGVFVGSSVAACIVKANNDPVFKSKVNKVLPGFSNLADTVGSKWKDPFGRRKDVIKDRLPEFVFQQEKPKRKPDIAKISSGESEEWDGSPLKKKPAAKLDTAQKHNEGIAEVSSLVSQQEEKISSTTASQGVGSGSTTAGCKEADGKESVSAKALKKGDVMGTSEPGSNKESVFEPVPKSEAGSSSVLGSNTEDNSSKEEKFSACTKEVTPSIEPKSESEKMVPIEVSKPEVVEEDPLVDPSESEELPQLRSEEKLRREPEAVSAVDPSDKYEDVLILNKKYEVLEQKLKEADAEHVKNMAIALEMQKKELEDLSEKKLESLLRESEEKHKAELTKAIDEETARYHAAVVEQMKVAQETYTLEKEVALRKLERSMSAWWVSQMDQRISALVSEHQMQLAKAYSRLAGVERMVDSVAEAGEKTVKFHKLRHLCDALVGNLERINSDRNYDVQRYLLEVDINSFRDVARDDPFIVATLESIPSQAIRGAGIQSEQQLKARFGRVRRNCRGVALVPAEGGGPFMYLLSYIQSALTFQRMPLPDVIYYPELEKMDTYEIIYLAEKRMRTGDLEGAVDCMAFLKGEPKRVASDWLDDARLYLETRQAIDLLQTYMRAKTFLK